MRGAIVAEKWLRKKLSDLGDSSRLNSEASGDIRIQLCFKTRATRTGSSRLVVVLLNGTSAGHSDDIIGLQAHYRVIVPNFKRGLLSIHSIHYWMDTATLGRQFGPPVVFGQKTKRGCNERLYLPPKASLTSSDALLGAN